MLFIQALQADQRLRLDRTHLVREERHPTRRHQRLGGLDVCQCLVGQFGIEAGYCVMSIEYVKMGDCGIEAVLREWAA